MRRVEYRKLKIVSLIIRSELEVRLLNRRLTCEAKRTRELVELKIEYKLVLLI